MCVQLSARSDIVKVVSMRAYIVALVCAFKEWVCVCQTLLWGKIT